MKTTEKKRGRRRSGTRLETRIVRQRKELIANSRGKTRFEETDKAWTKSMRGFFWSRGMAAYSIAGRS